MKKHFLLVLFFLTLFLPAWSQMRGDLNSDNQVDVSDVNIIIDMVLGKQAQNLSTADLDGNNLIDVADVNIIIDIILGKEQGGVDEPGIQTFTVNGVSFKMIHVEGSYFSIGETEVTQGLYEAVMGYNDAYYEYEAMGSQFPAHALLWRDCQSFINRLNELTGKKFRLPTEDEWEIAAKGGSRSKGYIYAGSDNYDEVAWYWRNSGDKYLEGDWSPSAVQGNNCRLHPVAMKLPNELGIYDMSGNAIEWCQDFHGTFIWDPDVWDPYGPACDRAPFYGVKGGGWLGVEIPIEQRSVQTDCGALTSIGLRLAL